MPKAPVDIKVDGIAVENLPESFDNIFDSLQLAAMFEVEVHKGPIGVFVSPIYYKGTDDESFTGPRGEGLKVSLEEKVWVILYGATYELGPWHLGKNSASPTVTLLPYVGGLYLHDDIKLKINPVLDIGLDYKTTISFNAPVVGLVTLWDLTKRWTLRIGGFYGGWDVDDLKKSWEFIGTVGYRFKMWNVSSQVFAGYKYLYVDYKKKGVELQVAVQGPLVGIGWEFYLVSIHKWPFLRRIPPWRDYPQVSGCGVRKVRLAANPAKRGRVLEIPTPRWSTYDAAKLGVEPPKGVPATI
jgi:hypothetical protein